MFNYYAALESKAKLEKRLQKAERGTKFYNGIVRKLIEIERVIGEAEEQRFEECY